MHGFFILTTHFVAFCIGLYILNTMNTLPPTSIDHYLTGQAALNIPNDNGDFADWHFTEVFLSGHGRFAVAGENIIDTSSIFGRYGVREVSDLLRQYGVVVPEGQPVYAANSVRAVLDLLLSAITKGKIPNYLTLDDTLDTEELRFEFQSKTQLIRKHIADKIILSLLDQWEQQQN